MMLGKNFSMKRNVWRKTTVSGRDLVRMDFTYLKNGVTTREIEYITLLNGHAYIITEDTASICYKDYSQAFDKITESYQIKIN